jgi:gamma-glutamyltranspeptidase/glutathione hydrolase/leukotriene-C4 hydrolase
VWKKVLTALASIILIIFIISSTLLLDTVKHPTGPFPAPPTPSKSPLPEPPSNLPPHERVEPKLIKAKNGAVATENELCSNIGVDVLKEGGNAVDAAIASTFCIGVVSMYS